MNKYIEPSILNWKLCNKVFVKNRFCNQFCKINIIIDCVIFVHFPCKIKIKAKCLGTRMVDKKTEHITKQLFRAFYADNFGWRLQCNHEVFHSFLLSCKNYIFYVMTHKDCGILWSNSKMLFLLKIISYCSWTILFL